MKKRILIIDDHPVMRFGLVQLIKAQPDLEICGEAGTAAEAMEFFERDVPDLALLDLSLPDKNGLELLKDIRARFENVEVLVVSMHDEALYAERVLRSGAKGYVMKEEAGERLVEAIDCVLGGKVFVSPRMSARIIEMFSGGTKASLSPLERLTDRELEVFELVGQGKGSRDIAELLHVSPRTVDAHRAHIKEKMGYEDGNTLIREAVRWVEVRTLG